MIAKEHYISHTIITINTFVPSKIGVVFIYTSVYLQPSKLVSNIQMLL